MGGSALKNTVTRRYLKDEYNEVTKFVTKILIDGIDVMEVACISSYTNKESFGDLDIVYSTYNDFPISKNYLIKLFGPNEVVVNSNVTSLNVRDFQVDFIHLPANEFDYGLNYFNYNDCGALIGKLAHQLGLKHGAYGLFMPVWFENQKIDDVLINLDHNKTLRVLGLSVEKFNAGFETQNDIFKFIAESQYFNPDIYLPENNTSIGRDKKRDTYLKFLDFCSNYTGTKYIKNVDNFTATNILVDEFPEYYSSYKNLIQNHVTKIYSAKKFNGNLVSELTGLSGKDLGNFMKLLKTNIEFKPENIALLNEVQIKELILKKFTLSLL